MLDQLNLRQSYHKPGDDIANDFYLPCLAAAETYDRAVGYFSSAIYVIAWTSLKQFVENGGRMRLICSPSLTSADADAIFEGYSRRAEVEQGGLVVSTFRQMLDSPVSMRPAKVLAALVALGVIEIKIAWVTDDAGARTQRLFHDKVGLFTDSSGGSIAFKGSMNETWAGLALDGNLESVDVFTSWSSNSDKDRVLAEKDYFERLWCDEYKGVDVRPLPEIARDELVANAETDEWESIVDELCLEIAATDRWVPGSGSDPRRPRAHQAAALDAWNDRNRRGILKHATGSGKTFTALCAISDSLAKREVPLVLVPSELLLKQWKAEIVGMFNEATTRTLICGGGNSNWKEQNLLRAWTRPPRAGAGRIVLSTIQSAASPSFLRQIDQGSHLFMVADEVHRLGAVEARRLLELDTGPRLGLSATPERAGDPTGTEALFEYFQGIVPPPFTLRDAIAAGALTPYTYHIHTIELTQDEKSQWDESTAKIRQMYARIQTTPSESAERAYKLELIRRSKIAKSAHNKVQMSADIVANNYRDGQRWIVYCDDQEQLTIVKREIGKQFDEKVYEYHSAMEGDRASTLSVFERYGGIVGSIKCLDEGVDIPAVDTALVLASSRNPREFIQRRGRVLRKAAGKSVAVIHDVLVTPTTTDESPDTAILEGEIARAIQFGRSALNPSSIAELERLAVAYNIELKDISDSGVEDDEDSLDG